LSRAARFACCSPSAAATSRQAGREAAAFEENARDDEESLVLVKICGITRRADAYAAIDAGAAAVGFVFWPESPRFIDPYRARGIAAALPPFVTTVGVFVDQPADHVSRVASLVRLSAVQLHGSETPDYAAALGRPVIKAVTLGERPGGGSLEEEQEEISQWPNHVALLLDVLDPVKHGGTGQVIDWNRAAPVAARRPVLLAGGLTPENVAAAIRRVRPFGIDVSSGVEESPGVKDHGRVRALFKAIEMIHADTYLPS
jgi:phosphoribosylanthranilate isomerase